MVFNYNIKIICSGSADAIITLANGGANVESHDKDGLTGNCLKIRTENWGLGAFNITVGI